MTSVLEGIKYKNEERRRKKEAKIKQCANKHKARQNSIQKSIIAHTRTSSLTNNYMQKTFVEPSITTAYESQFMYVLFIDP